jgi:hypothetical protein
MTTVDHLCAISALPPRFPRSFALKNAATEQQDYPERTGLWVPLERYCHRFQALMAPRDPAPPAS